MHSRFSTRVARFPFFRTVAGIQSLQNRIRAALLVVPLAGFLAGAAPVLSAPVGSAVVGSGVTTKIGQREQVVFTLVNYDIQATSFQFEIQSVPKGLVVDGEATGQVAVEGRQANTLAFAFSVGVGTPLGFNDITVGWSNTNTGETGRAAARVLITPYDDYSPTLYSTPNPAHLTGSVSGGATTVAGCLTDSLGVATGWNIQGLCPYLYSTEVTNPKEGSSGLVVADPMSGGIDILAGAPTLIQQALTLSNSPDPIVLNVVSIRMDVTTSAGLKTTTAFSRYAVVSTQANSIGEPVEPLTWSRLKGVFGPR